MNLRTLRATLREIDPDFRIIRQPDRLSVEVSGRRITVGSGNALAMLTRDELRERIKRAG